MVVGTQSCQSSLTSGQERVPRYGCFGAGPLMIRAWPHSTV